MVVHNVQYIIAILMLLVNDDDADDDIIMMLYLAVVVARFGRRRPLLVFHLTAATVLFANIFIPRETGLVPTICLVVF